MLAFVATLSLPFLRTFGQFWGQFDSDQFDQTLHQERQQSADNKRGRTTDAENQTASKRMTATKGKKPDERATTKHTTKAIDEDINAASNNCGLLLRAKWNREITRGIGGGQSSAQAPRATTEIAALPLPT